jgi:DNA-binding MarR family transcriptional regulator
MPPYASDHLSASSLAPSLPTDPRDILAWHLIRLASTVRRAAAQRFRRMFDMTMIEWQIVAHLAAEAPVSLTALARNASLDTQRTSVAVARLAKRQLVSRAQNPANRREARVALTPRGWAVFNAMIENWLGKEFAHGLSEAEIASANDVLGRLAEKADQILAKELKSAV